MTEGCKDFLDDFLHPGLSYAFRLDAAWDGFSTETKITFLKRLLRKLQQLSVYGKRTPYSIEWIKTATRQAMEDDNAYVRYLGARLWPKGEDNDFFAHKISTDPSALVQNLDLEDSFGACVKDPQAFFALRPDQRLACLQVNEIVLVSINELVNLIKYAIQPDSGVPPEDIHTLLLEVLTNDEWRKGYIDVQPSYDGWREYTYKKDLPSLWQLAPKIPDPAAELILRYVPTQVEGPDDCVIPDEVLDTLSKDQLAVLFFRDDVELPNLRKKYFIAELDQPRFSRSQLRRAACQYYFMLSIEEFGEILKKPTEIRVGILCDIVWSESRWLPPYFIAAASDCLFYHHGNSGYLDIASKHFDVCLEGYRKNDSEMSRLGIYNLAYKTAPWPSDFTDSKRKPLPDEFAWLEKHVVEGDPWATFQNFANLPGRFWVSSQESLKKLIPLWDDEKERSDVKTMAGLTRESLKEIVSQTLDERLIEFEQTVAKASIVHEVEQQNNSMTEEIGSLKEQLSEVEGQLKASRAGKRKTQLLLFAVVAVSIFWVLFGA